MRDRCSLFLSCPPPCHLFLLSCSSSCFVLPLEVAAAPNTRNKNIRTARRKLLQRRNIEGFSPTADEGPVGVDIGLPALVHSGFDFDLLTYEQALVQDG